jgi:DNA replication and repair protein RecF
MMRGFTLTGPHREDFSIYFDGVLMSETASRGEARTTMLTLKIMELKIIEERTDKTPILLLDDVFSELDGSRRQALTSFLKNYQTFITTTDADMVVQYFIDQTKIKIIPID